MSRSLQSEIETFVGDKNRTIKQRKELIQRINLAMYTSKIPKYRKEMYENIISQIRILPVQEINLTEENNTHNQDFQSKVEKPFEKYYSQLEEITQNLSNREMYQIAMKENMTATNQGWIFSTDKEVYFTNQGVSIQTNKTGNSKKRIFEFNNREDVETIKRLKEKGFFVLDYKPIEVFNGKEGSLIKCELTINNYRDIIGRAYVNRTILPSEDQPFGQIAWINVRNSNTKTQIDLGEDNDKYTRQKTLVLKGGKKLFLIGTEYEHRHWRGAIEKLFDEKSEQFFDVELENGVPIYKEVINPIHSLYVELNRNECCLERDYSLIQLFNESKLEYFTNK